MAKLSIVIKALNEEQNIGRAIESSLAAAAPYDGEVILADSASTDRTVAIAKKFPVSIVQLEDPAERSCGVGPQLGYQHSAGEYIYILDGDMELKAPFLEKAIALLDREPKVAGVGGFIHEMRTDNLELKGRIKRFKRIRQKRSRDVHCLNGGGLYRRAAIADVRYLSDRNLHAFEEYDLGVRLRTNGWKLVLLEEKAVDHYSYPMGTWRLLVHRFLSGRFSSTGELLRAASEMHYVVHLLREQRVVALAIGVWLYWGVVLAASAWFSHSIAHWRTILIALALPVVAMAVRTRSLKLGAFSVATWHFAAGGLLVGFFRKRISPLLPVRSKVLQTVPREELLGRQRG
jgi:glycosyltransferase involved in cell wall biosynthesis